MQSSMLQLALHSTRSRPCCIRVEAVSRKNNRPARRRAHKLWKQQKKQEQQWQSVTQKQHVWYEVVEPPITPQAAQTRPKPNSSNTGFNQARRSSISSIIGGGAVSHEFWVEHRRSAEEQEHFKQEQLRHRPTPKRRACIDDLLQADVTTQQLGSQPGNWPAQQQWQQDALGLLEANGGLGSASKQQPWQQQQQQMQWPQAGFLQQQTWDQGSLWQQQQQQQQQYGQDLQWHKQVQPAAGPSHLQQQQQGRDSQVWRQQPQQPMQAAPSSERMLMDMYVLQGSSSRRHSPWGGGCNRQWYADAGSDKQVQQQQHRWQQQSGAVVGSPASMQQPAMQQTDLLLPGGQQQEMRQGSSSQGVKVLGFDQASQLSQISGKSSSSGSSQRAAQPVAEQQVRTAATTEEVAHEDDDWYMDDAW